jgi:putative flippase GtrA
MAIVLRTGETDLERFISAINELAEGRSHSTGRFTLTPGATTTVVPFQNCSASSEPQFSPRTANAAAAVPTTYISAIANGSFTLTHANNAQIDRTFGFTVIGG